MEPKSLAAELYRKAESYGTQAKRLGHTADRISKIQSRLTAPEPKQILSEQNKLTMDAFNRGIVDYDDTAEVEIVSKIRLTRPDAAAITATYDRAKIWYETMQKSTKEKAMQENRKQATERMENRKHGVKAMSCAINSTPPKPLLHTRRDKVGPNGQAVGTITTSPTEVDSIAIRAWMNIYRGNVDDLVQAAKDFTDKYSKFKDAIFKAPEFKVEPITGRELMKTCTHAKMTTAGLDNWEPAELGMLSLKTFDWLAEMLNLVEQGSPWPDGMEHAKAAYLSKSTDKTDDPLSYRVLMILPALPRRWATHRLQDLKPWTEQMGTE